MKCCKRYLSLLLCFLLLSIVFSINVSAESETLKNYSITSQSIVCQESSCYSLGTLTFHPNNGDYECFEYESLDGWFTQYGMQNESYHSVSYNITLDDNSEILKGGQNHTVTLSNFYFSCYVEGILNSFYARSLDSVSIALYDSTGSLYSYVTDYDIKQSGPNVSFTFDVKPDKNITSIHLTLASDIDNKMQHSPNNGYVPVTVYLGEMYGDNSYNFDINIESEESGLLKTVIEWLKGIKNGLTDGFTNLFNSITELPSKIWGFIQEGLKSLFVPDVSFIESFKYDIEMLLSEKLGAVYQVIEITLESWDSIKANDQANTISFPSTTINLPDNNSFSFGGYDVQIVPNGFTFIVDILKTLVGIVCTIMFINGLRKRYDEVMGVEQ